MKLNPLQKFYLGRLLSKLATVPMVLREEIGYLKIKELIEKILSEKTESQQEVFQALAQVNLPKGARAVTQANASPYNIFLKGFCYWQGIGVEPNNEAAIELFNKIYDDHLAGCAKAQIYLELEENKIATENKLQIIDRLLHTAVVSEPEIANYLLGRFALIKKLPSRKAIESFSIASKAGFSSADSPLADLLRQSGLGENLKQARALYAKACVQGDTHALYQFSVLCENGVGGPKDLKTSFDCCYKAAKLQHGNARVALGLKYLRGIGIEADLKSAFEWLSRADKTGDLSLEAEFEIARFYAKGLAGASKDLNVACFRFRKILEAKEKNNPNQASSRTNQVASSTNDSGTINTTISALQTLQKQTVFELADIRKDMIVMARSGNIFMQSMLAYLYNRNLFYKPMLNESDYRLMLAKIELNLIDELDLSDQYVTPNMLDLLIARLKNNNSVKTLDLTGVSLEPATVQVLSNVLEQNGSIKTLYLGKTKNGLISITNALMENQNTVLQRLWLQDRVLDFNCLKRLKTLLVNNQSLCHITIALNRNEAQSLNFRTDRIPTVQDVRDMLSKEDNKKYSDEVIEDTIISIEGYLDCNQNILKKANLVAEKAVDQEKMAEMNKKPLPLNNLESKQDENLFESLTEDEQAKERAELVREEQEELRRCLASKDRQMIEEQQLKWSAQLRTDFHDYLAQQETPQEDKQLTELYRAQNKLDFNPDFLSRGLRFSNFPTPRGHRKTTKDHPFTFILDEDLHECNEPYQYSPRPSAMAG